MDLSDLPPQKKAKLQFEPGWKKFFTKKRLLIAGSVGFVLLILLWFFGIRPAKNAYAHLRQAQNKLTELQDLQSNLDFASIQATLTESMAHLDIASADLAQLGWVGFVPLIGQDYDSSRELLSVTQDLLADLQVFLDDTKPILQKLNFVQGSDETGEVDNPASELGSVLLDDVDDLQLAIERMQASVKVSLMKYDRIANHAFLPALANASKLIVEKIKSLDTMLDSTVDVIAILPEIMGKDQPQNYLLVVQNNTEIRALGGFWGNYGMMTIENGKIGEIELNDIYKIDTDPQAYSYGHDIPYPLGSYLDQRNLHLRDTNWWPDLPTSSQVMIDYYQYLTGQQVDGIIAIDPIVVEDIMRILGPITVPRYDVEVSAENVTYQIQYQVHRNIYSYETRKDFVGELGELLAAQVMSASGEDLKQIIKSLWTNLDERHVQLYSQNPAIQQWYCDQKWCGEVQSGYDDYLLVVDANIGINKANFFVHDEIFHKLIIDREANVTAETTVLYENLSDWNWPGGPYTTYTRVYVPLGSELIEAQGFLDDVQQYTEYEGSSKAKTVFAGIARTDVTSTHEIKLIYRLPTAVSANSIFNIYIQKQAGTSTIPGQFEIRGYPLAIEIQNDSAYALSNQSEYVSTNEDNILKFTTDLVSDREIVLSIED